MATLANGINTLIFGNSNWISVMNANFLLLKRGALVDDNLTAKSPSGHLHSNEYSLTSVVMTQTNLQPLLESIDEDVVFTNNTKGLVVVDTIAATNIRIYIDNGIILTETVV